MKDQLLLEGIYAGREEAYKSLFLLYFEPLTLFANKYLNDIDLSKDMVQEVFGQLYEKREQIQIEESLKSFLYRAVNNRCLNSLKRDSMKDRHHKVIKLHSREDHYEDVMETAELESKIRQLMNSLPGECQRIFKMSRLEHKTNQEIADALQISKRTVETQISKALKIFREGLKIIILNFLFKIF